MKYIFSVFVLMLAAHFALAQEINPVKWEFAIEETGKGTVEVVATATIEEGWKIYGTDFADGGPVKTSFGLNSEGVEAVGEIIEVEPAKEGYDEMFEMTIKFFKGKAILKQVYKLPKGTKELVGYVQFMACDREQCLPPTEVEFSFNLDE